MPVDDKDRKIFEMVTDVPKLSKVVAVFAVLLNLVLPGSGTLLAACSVEDNEKVSKT